MKENCLVSFMCVMVRVLMELCQIGFKGILMLSVEGFQYLWFLEKVGARDRQSAVMFKVHVCRGHQELS